MMETFLRKRGVSTEALDKLLKDKVFKLHLNPLVVYCKPWLNSHALALKPRQIQRGKGVCRGVCLWRGGGG